MGKTVLGPRLLRQAGHWRLMVTCMGCPALQRSATAVLCSMEGFLLENNNTNLIIFCYLAISLTSDATVT